MGYRLTRRRQREIEREAEHFGRHYDRLNEVLEEAERKPAETQEPPQKETDRDGQ